MKYSYNWLKEFVPKLPSPERLAERIARHAFEVEGMERVGGDTILDVAVLANRMPDAGGHIGFAREIAAIAKLHSTFPEPRALTPFGKKFLDIKIAARAAVPRYYGALICGVKIQPSPKWLRDRLQALGVNSINNVVDITNYVMLEWGHPLHAFDYDKIRGKRLTVRLSRDGESIETLDDVKRKLPAGAIVIEDAGRIIDLAGIMGGANSAVSSKTKNVFLQVANFSAPLIHRASVQIGKRTDAAARYASGLDPNAADTALALAVELMKELAAGELAGVLDMYPRRVESAKILFSPEKANRILGTELAEKEMRSILERLSFRIESKPAQGWSASGRKNGWLVTAPTARRDILIEEDLIEEIGRLHGYDAIREARPMSELASAVIDTKLAYIERTRSAFRNAGFDEVRTYSFVGEREIMELDAGTRSTLIALENPQSSEAAFLRPVLLPSVIRAAAEAIKFEKAVRVAEIARVFRRAGAVRDTPDFEENQLAFVWAEKIKKGEKQVVFYELKGALDSVFESLGLPDVWYDDVPSSASERAQGVGRLLHPHQSAHIKIGDTAVGVMGAIHPDVCRAWDIPASAAGGELYLDLFEKELEREKEYRPIPKYPAVLRDVAVLVPKNIRMTDVEDIIQNAGGALLADVDLFDVFEGGDSPAGGDANRKSLAFHLIFQSEDRTLTDADVEALMKTIIAALEANPDWEVR